MENILLAATGGLLGLGLGYAMLRALLAAMPQFTLPWEADTRAQLSRPAVYYVRRNICRSALRVDSCLACVANSTG